MEMSESGRVAAHEKRKLYVANLKAGMTTESLTEEFEKYGKVVEAHILNRKGRGGRLSGFVTFHDHESAVMAVEALQDWYPDGDSQKVTIKLADVKGTFDESEEVTAARQPPYKLYVSNLPPNSTTDYITEIFEMYGEISDCYMLFNRGRGGRRSSFVTYTNLSSALDALSALSDQLFDDDQRLTVRWAEPPKPGAANGPPPQPAPTQGKPHPVIPVNIPGPMKAPQPVDMLTAQQNQLLLDPSLLTAMQPAIPMNMLVGSNMVNMPMNMGGVPMNMAPFANMLPMGLAQQQHQQEATAPVSAIAAAAAQQPLQPTTPLSKAVVKLYVSNIAGGWDESNLKRIFSAYGEITDASIFPAKQQHASRSGFVWIMGPEAATAAIASLHNCKPPGCDVPLKVKVAT
eukprot:TRINITY_DN13400_c0_g1_i2.p1 TRINITY_DN13400_c0_g1~~TRINITY_DN13400_c0_g1_i2.p1  ORF type:complete len:402 (+),score=82.89 TRINITY_DN13400_c0_g1_i2:95-1300(+)